MKTCTRFLIFGYILVAICTLTGCKTTEYVPVPYPEYHTEWKHDSIDRWRTHYVYQKGDTVFSIDTLYQDRWHTLWKHDSVDVPQPYPVHDTTYVKTPLTGFQKFQQRSWWWLSVGLAGYVLFRTRKWWLRLLIRK